MRVLKDLFDNNRKWVESKLDADPDFFKRLAHTQSPRVLWIGCADSRVPANEIIGLPSGEVFVHRNVANVVVHADMNCLSVLQYAIEALRIEHVIVCGHYGCGGVKAAMDGTQLGLIDNWLRHVHDVYRFHRDALDKLPEEERFQRFCEMNVIEQVRNVGHTSIVQEAWRAGQSISIHGWIYGVHDGRLRDLGVCVTGADELGTLDLEEMKSRW
jgi:carbonic anhydrase